MSPDSTSLVIPFMAESAAFRDPVNPGDEDRAVVLDGDVHAVLVLQGVDRLAAGTDEQPDLVRRDLQHLDARGVVETSDRGSAMVSRMISRISILPLLAWSSASLRSCAETPVIFMSICSAVMPSRVPATLKSMSPMWSSRPWMSVRMT